MNATIQLYGKPVRVELSAAAERALAKRAERLYAEVQLIFGCMVAKRVWFSDEANKDAVPVTPKLSLWFRPARYEKACSFDEIDSGAVCGPGMALAWSYRHFVMSFTTSQMIRKLIYVFTAFTSFFLKYFDRFLIDKAGTIDAAAVHYFLGRKSDTALPDRELIKKYRGAQLI